MSSDAARGERDDMGLGSAVAAHREADAPSRPAHCHASGAGQLSGVSSVFGKKDVRPTGPDWQGVRCVILSGVATSSVGEKKRQETIGVMARVQGIGCSLSDPEVNRSAREPML